MGQKLQILFVKTFLCAGDLFLQIRCLFLYETSLTTEGRVSNLNKTIEHDSLSTCCWDTEQTYTENTEL